MDSCHPWIKQTQDYLNKEYYLQIKATVHLPLYLEIGTRVSQLALGLLRTDCDYKPSLSSLFCEITYTAFVHAFSVHSIC